MIGRWLKRQRIRYVCWRFSRNATPQELLAVRAELAAILVTINTARVYGYTGSSWHEANAYIDSIYDPAAPRSDQ